MDHANGTFSSCVGVARAAGNVCGTAVSAVSLPGRRGFTADTAVPPAGRPAFSLAELMIALVILGLGLLFIAAALPVGLEYTRQTVDKANADAAASCALDQLEMNLRTAGDNLYDPSLALLSIWHRLDNIHRPRDYDPGSTPPRYALNKTYEPVFKVRPLVMGNVRMGSVPSGSTREIVDDVEATILAYLRALGGAMPAAPLEVDIAMSANTGLSLGENALLPGLARIYPPIEPVTTFSVGNFFTDQDAYPMYAPRFNRLDRFGELEREREKSLDRRVSYTAFYRRIHYPEPGPDNVFGTPDDVMKEPVELLYELIIVVTQRVSVNHRFPRQRLASSGNSLTEFEQPAAWSPTDNVVDNPNVGKDRLAPTPWLVTFDSAATNPPALPLLETFGSNLYVGRDRTILANTSFDDPATLTFRCTAEVGALLPVGSIFIPAFNDLHYLDPPNVDTRASGFVPHAPATLPIYEVVERPDVTTVVVKNNGHYPWVATGNPNATQAWPVWVIPPAFVQRDSNGQPVYERSSPILKVVRRTVSLHEVNR